MNQVDYRVEKLIKLCCKLKSDEFPEITSLALELKPKQSEAWVQGDELERSAFSKQLDPSVYTFCIYASDYEQFTYHKVCDSEHLAWKYFKKLLLHHEVGGGTYYLCYWRKNR